MVAAGVGAVAVVALAGAGAVVDFAGAGLVGAVFLPILSAPVCANDTIMPNAIVANVNVNFFMMCEVLLRIDI